MRSGKAERNWWIDLPKLTLLATYNDSASFYNPRIITLEGFLCHSTLTNRHTFSHHRYSLQEECLQKEEDRSYQESLFHLSFIPRHHSRSFWLPLLSSFFQTQQYHHYKHSSQTKKANNTQRYPTNTNTTQKRSTTTSFPSQAAFPRTRGAPSDCHTQCWAFSQIPESTTCTAPAWKPQRNWSRDAASPPRTRCSARKSADLRIMPSLNRHSTRGCGSRTEPCCLHSW